MKLALFLVAIGATASKAFVLRPAAHTGNLDRSKSIKMLPIHELSVPLVSEFIDHASTNLISATDFSSPPESDGISYSKVSYYTVLGLYLMSLPGLWSIVKRSTAAKVKRKTYVTPGGNSTAANAKGLRQQAGEIMACKF